MDWLIIVLRIVHIFSGVAWVGGGALFFFYLEPTIRTLGPDAEKFVGEMVGRRKLPRYFLASATLTVVFGFLLYWRDSNGLQSSWITSPSGLGFTIGGLSAFVAWVLTTMFIPRLLQRVGEAGARLRAAGVPPDAELIGAVRRAQQSLRTGLALNLAFLGVALLGMESARYLG
jgi:uncharacterized membrane protein